MISSDSVNWEEDRVSSLQGIPPSLDLVTLDGDGNLKFWEFLALNLVGVLQHFFVCLSLSSLHNSGRSALFVSYAQSC